MQDNRYIDPLHWSSTFSSATLVKAMVFPVVMYGCESWTVKKAECRIIDAFELFVFLSQETLL